MVCYNAFSFLILHKKIEKSHLFILSTIKSAMTNLFIDSESFGGKNVWRVILGSANYCQVFSVKLLETFLLACENPMADIPVVARMGTIDLRPFEVKKIYLHKSVDTHMNHERRKNT